MKTTSLLFALCLPCLATAEDAPAPDANHKPADQTEEKDAAKPAIVGSSWQVDKIDGKDVVAKSRMFIQFDTDQKVTGDSGVNRFFGSCKIAGNELSFRALGSTQRGGDRDAMDQEQRFFAALNEVNSYQLDDTGQLRFFNADGKEIVLLSPRQGR